MRVLLAPVASEGVDVIRIIGELQEEERMKRRGVSGFNVFRWKRSRTGGKAARALGL